MMMTKVEIDAFPQQSDHNDAVIMEATRGNILSTSSDEVRASGNRSPDNISDQTGVVGEMRNRLRDGSATPVLVTPSSSFLIGSIDPSIVAVQEEDQDERIKSQAEQCEVEEKETSSPIKEPANSVLTTPKEGTEIDAPSDQNQRPRFWKAILFRRILPLLILIEAALLFAERVLDLPFDPTFSLHDAPIHADSVYVPGAGFSGYWFTLGRLKNIPDPSSKAYYCYSAGCLGVVATLSQKSMEEVFDLAFGVQRRWKEGTLDRYDVVAKFVDGLLFGNGIEDQGSEVSSNVTSPVMSDAKLLSRIHIITTAKNVVGVRSVVRTPESIDELRKMLLHTTWIPWATGDGLWTQDASTGHDHMDGAFSATTHPRCTHHLGLPFMLDLFMNALNVNLGREKVEKFWNAGVLHGI